MGDNSKSAILVIEFQKTWKERSFFHKLIKKEYELISDCTAIRNGKLQKKIEDKFDHITSTQLANEIGKKYNKANALRQAKAILCSAFTCR